MSLPPPFFFFGGGDLDSRHPKTQKWPLAQIKRSPGEEKVAQYTWRVGEIPGFIIVSFISMLLLPRVLVANRYLKLWGRDPSSQLGETVVPGGQGELCYLFFLYVYPFVSPKKGHIMKSIWQSGQIKPQFSARSLKRGASRNWNALWREQRVRSLRKWPYESVYGLLVPWAGQV